MRIWSIHLKYLDRIGFIVLWQEGLLAKKVLEGKTRGYKNHPRLIRFKNYKRPLGAINSYLFWVFEESEKKGQLKFEFEYLIKKLKNRTPDNYFKLRNLKVNLPCPNPIFLCYYRR